MSHDCSIWNRRTWGRVQTYKVLMPDWWALNGIADSLRGDVNRKCFIQHVLFRRCSCLHPSALDLRAQMLSDAVSVTFSQLLCSAVVSVSRRDLEPDLWRSSPQDHSAREQISCFCRTLKTHLYAFSWYYKVLYIAVMGLWLAYLKMQCDCGINKMQQKSLLLEKDYEVPSIHFHFHIFFHLGQGCWGKYPQKETFQSLLGAKRC